MISPLAGARIYLACGVTDMRKGFDGLVAQVEAVLKLDPYGGSLFIFRGRRGDIVKGIYFDGQGLVLYAKRLEKGRFVWPQAKDGMITLTAAQLSMLAEGIELLHSVVNYTAVPDQFSRASQIMEDGKGCNVAACDLRNETVLPREATRRNKRFRDYLKSITKRAQEGAWAATGAHFSVPFSPARLSRAVASSDAGRYHGHGLCGCRK